MKSPLLRRNFTTSSCSARAYFPRQALQLVIGLRARKQNVSRVLSL